MNNKNITRKSLVVNLTEQEITDFSKELARITTLQAEIEEEKKTVTSSYKEKLDRCISESRSLARKISTRQDFREVECEWRFDYDRRMKRLVRMDTWEQVEERKLTADELQDELDFGKPQQEEHPPGCPKCEGDGEYYGEEGQVYCDCEAGVALRAKEQSEVAEKTSAPLCATCIGDCSYEHTEFSLFHNLDQCADYRDTPSPKQEQSRDDTCNKWRECSYAFKCFGPANDESGLCFKQIEEAREAESEESSSDPLANEQGVYVNAEEITIPMPAKARATASINVIQCSDGFWRNGHNHHMRDCGGGGGLPSVKSMGHCTRYDAILDALDALVTKFEGYVGLTNSPAASRAKIAIEAVGKFKESLAPEPRKGSRCPICDFVGYNKAELTKHIRAAHGVSLQETVAVANGQAVDDSAGAAA